MAWLKKEIKNQFLKDGNKMYIENAKYIANYLSSNNLTLVNNTNIEIGNFYFVFNDLNGKSSKMEQFIPCIYLGNVDTLEGNKSLCFSFNFVPVAIRTVLLDKLLESYDNSLIKENIKKKSIREEQTYANINFDRTYNALRSIGFEYTIREIYTKNINKVVRIATKDLPKFITMNTYLFTGVPEDKLAQIWVAKIKDREKREQDFLKKLMGDYDKMTKEIQDSISEQQVNIDKSYTNIKNLINNSK